MQQKQWRSSRLLRFIPYVVIGLVAVVAIAVIASSVISANAFKFAEYLVTRAQGYCERQLDTVTAEYLEIHNENPLWIDLANCSDFARRAYADYPSTLINCDTSSISDLEFDECADVRFASIVDKYLGEPIISTLERLCMLDEFDTQTVSNCAFFMGRRLRDYSDLISACYYDSLSTSTVDRNKCYQEHQIIFIPTPTPTLMPTATPLPALRTPEGAAEAWFTFALSSDIDGVKASTCAAGQTAVEDAAEAFGSLANSGATVDASGLTYTKASESGDDATVTIGGTIKVSAAGQEVDQPMENVTMPLKKEDGAWKVCGF